MRLRQKKEIRNLDFQFSAPFHVSYKQTKINFYIHYDYVITRHLISSVILHIVRDPTVRDSKSKLRDSTACDSTVRDPTVHDSTVRSPTVRDATVSDSTARGSTTRDPTVRDSTIRDSVIPDFTRVPKAPIQKLFDKCNQSLSGNKHCFLSS